MEVGRHLCLGNQAWTLSKVALQMQFLFKDEEHRLGNAYCQAFISYKTQKQILPGINWEEMYKKLIVSPQDLLEEV